MFAPTLTRETSSLGVGCCLPSDDVVKSRLDDDGVFVQHTQGAIAPVAENLSGDTSGVAMINVTGSTPGFCERDATDSTSIALSPQHSFVFFKRDAVGLDEMVVAPVSSGAHFFSASPLGFSISLTVEPLVSSDGIEAGPAIGMSNDIDLLGTVGAPSFAQGFVLGREPVLFVDSRSAAPVVALGVPFNGHLATADTDCSAVGDVNAGEDVAVTSLPTSMTSDVSKRSSFDHVSTEVVSRRDRSCFSASTVAQAEGDLAGVVAPTLFTHDNSLVHKLDELYILHERI